jgi:hypothetical protein
MGIVAPIFQWYFPHCQTIHFMFVQGKFKFFLIDGLIGNPKKVSCGSHVSLDNFGREINVMLGMNILIH